MINEDEYAVRMDKTPPPADEPDERFFTKRIMAEIRQRMSGEWADSIEEIIDQELEFLAVELTEDFNTIRIGEFSDNQIYHPDYTFTLAELLDARLKDTIDSIQYCATNEEYLGEVDKLEVAVNALSGKVDALKAKLTELRAAGLEQEPDEPDRV